MPGGREMWPRTDCNTKPVMFEFPLACVESLKLPEIEPTSASTALAVLSHPTLILNLAMWFVSVSETIAKADLSLYAETWKILVSCDFLLQLLEPWATTTLTLQVGLFHGGHRPRHPLYPNSQPCLEAEMRAGELADDAGWLQIKSEPSRDQLRRSQTSVFWEGIVGIHLRGE